MKNARGAQAMIIACTWSDGELGASCLATFALRAPAPLGNHISPQRPSVGPWRGLPWGLRELASPDPGGARARDPGSASHRSLVEKGGGFLLFEGRDPLKRSVTDHQLMKGSRGLGPHIRGRKFDDREGNTMTGPQLCAWRMKRASENDDREQHLRSGFASPPSGAPPLRSRRREGRRRADEDESHKRALKDTTRLP